MASMVPTNYVTKVSLDAPQTLLLVVTQQGAGDDGSGPTKLVGRLDLVGDEELDVLGHGRALVGRVRLLKQLDERVGVARNVFVGEGIDVNPSPCSVATRMKMPVRVLWSLAQLTLRRVPAKASVPAPASMPFRLAHLVASSEAALAKVATSLAGASPRLSASELGMSGIA